MRVSSILSSTLVFCVAAGASFFAANSSVGIIEDRSEIGVRRALDERGLTWAEVVADGLQVNLTGTAPSEALRFQALTAAGSIVDPARLFDAMDVEDSSGLAPPRFSAEILRNDHGISVIGLIPKSVNREDLAQRFEALSGAQEVADLLQTADHPVPQGWSDALNFGIWALSELKRAKISIQAGRVDITAISDSPNEKRVLEKFLQRNTPPGLNVSLDIAAPRPVLTPFTLRFVKDEEGARFDACSADTIKARTRIMEAAAKAGLNTGARCKIGLGVPSPRWSEAVESTIRAIGLLNAGSATFSDADIQLRAQEGTDPDVFDQVVAELRSALPPVFVLNAVLPEIVDPQTEVPEFIATLSPEGLVQLRGLLPNDKSQDLITSYAQALFGADVITTAARVRNDLPGDWQTRTMTGLLALSELSNGALILSPDTLTIRGNTGNKDGKSNIAQILASKLKSPGEIDLQITYLEKLDPIANRPSPDACEENIAKVLMAGKLSFEPGSATLTEESLGTMGNIAEILLDCGDLNLEIQGHTDSQGREEMNLALSQQRANSVLAELRARKVLTRTFSAVGYGETQPIADNDTEEGREANRRIEFRLIRPKPTVKETESTLESLSQEPPQTQESPDE
jgi:OOP family OmpA-OmpF porin